MDILYVYPRIDYLNHHDRRHLIMATIRSIAESPFDDLTANIVLRTSDNVDFYVYKEILKVASSFFQTLFSLPQPTPVPSSDSTHTTQDEFSPEGLPIIPVPEASSALDHILRICYPRRNPERLSSLVLAEQVLIAALKYEIETAIDIAKEDFRSLGSDSPAQVYMISCKHNFEDEARLAADLLRQQYDLANLNRPIPGDTDFVRIGLEVYSDDYGRFPAVYLYRLLRHICFGDVTSFCDASEQGGHSPGSEDPRRLPPELEDLFVDYPADIFLQSSDGIIIPAHKVILRAASATSILSLSEATTCPRQNEIPVVSLQHSSYLLTQLVLACYPLFSDLIHIHQADDDMRLFHIAQSYNMHGVASIAKSRWLSNTASDPITTYIVSSLNGWAKEADDGLQEVALRVNSVSTTCVSGMNLVGSARYYYALLQHLNKMNQRLQDLISQPSSTFLLRNDEKWNDPFYACKPCITPVVAFRALQTLQNPYNPLQDPPGQHESSYGNEWWACPAAFVRQMVFASEQIGQQRHDAILAVSVKVDSSRASRELNYLRR